MPPSDQDHDLPEYLRRGQDLSKLLGGESTPKTRNRAKRWFGKGKLIAAAVAVSLVTITTLANGSFDLWGNASGAMNGSSNEIDVDFSESGPSNLGGPAGDTEVWTDEDSSCRQTFGEVAPLIAESDESDIAAIPPGELELGGSESTDGGVAVWRHEDEIALPEGAYTETEFRDILDGGWSQQGDRVVDIRVGNRTADPLIIANISIEVERIAPLAGTAIELLGGGSTLTTVVGFDLGEEVPVARIREGEDASTPCALGGPFFESYQIHVDPETIETIKVGILGTETLCLVRLKIEFWHEGEWKSMTYPTESNEPIHVVSPPVGYQTDRTYLATPGEDGLELTIAE
ncbi:hypothetical protein [Glycomyces tritici]|uniref:Uncharacterized protein n=1 Tax=Glycomyces tritici TaxID=2665176 RepID=A0ABT7YXN8_9ACTN|nr:hypothetical protein [Glycomyces tritici]MDN3243411.1 hypothetical protein [Glycomyces tritici]